jgi:D-glycero-beta-D-manno-heptose-7-phosphate kinase
MEAQIPISPKITPAEITSRIGNARVLVVGDVMLDKYWFADVNRISPEAPVPVALVKHQEARPGGAANVARNITSLGGSAVLLSVTGNDDAARQLEQILKKDKVTSIFKYDTDISTTIKLRVVAHQQQLVRIDFENTPSESLLADVFNEYASLLPEYDVVVLSDYGKGGLDHAARMIEFAREFGKPVLVDPKGDNYSKYRGATLLTPNKNEFRQVAGTWQNEDELIEKAESLRRHLDLKALLITRSEEGMSLYTENKVVNVPAQAQEVFDVTGAGDTVIATLALMLAAGQSLEQATYWANRAAGAVVRKFGTAAPHINELFD